MRRIINKKTALILTLLAVIAGTSLAGCAKDNTNNDISTNNETSTNDENNTQKTEEKDISNTLNFGCTNFSDSLDPSTMINAAWCVSRYGIGEGLFHFDDEMNADYYLCDNYSVDETNTNWVFHIRDGVKFSNGNDLTPSKVVASLSYMYSQEAEGTGNSTPSQYMTYDSITADDSAGTVTIVTSKPYADLCSILAHPYYSILDVEQGNISENPIGTGPYAIVSYDTDVSIKMAANEYYWGKEVPYQNLNIIFIKDTTTKALAIRNGDVDVVENINSSNDLTTLQDSSDFNVSEATGIRCGFSYMNQKGILANEALRNAVLLALDDETMCNITVGGMYTAGYSVLPSGLDYGYQNLKDSTPFDVEAAVKCLDDAGITDTDGDGYRELNGQMINLNYLTYDSRNLTDFTEAIAVQLDSIGIKVTVNTTDADTEWNMLVSGEYDLLATNWMTVPVGDPYSYLDNWYSKSTANYCGYANEEYDRLYEELESELNKDARAKLIEQLQQILIDDAAVLVHGYYHSNMCSVASVTGANIYTADYYWITADIEPSN
ncbi:peptide/nickel transport system substrate-binding protein [Lachnotalea glycerini]|uniref:Peptide/nickel transport system substrate-binding protein n=1 Tax=Lachnotalea glycerini TaxID=1763509 RepID=A0A318ERG4_9FIRM|nr:ABC transporter substrate-binding protein [Lachnotalea glycerini]PXV89413.1 peptide/nickel transport system substrate-binding protein [Lachnotalea glycerini]